MGGALGILTRSPVAKHKRLVVIEVHWTWSTDTSVRKMRIRLRIKKRGALLYEGVHEIIDHESFGAAFADVWRSVRERQLEKTTSVGELMDIINDEMLDQLQGAEISIQKA